MALSPVMIDFIIISIFKRIEAYANQQGGLNWNDLKRDGETWEQAEERVKKELETKPNAHFG